MGNPNVNITNCTGRTVLLDSNYTLADALTAVPTLTHATALQVINDAVLATCTDTTDADPGNSPVLTGLTLPQGLFLQGRFTVCTVTSGVVRAYLA